MIEKESLHQLLISARSAEESLTNNLRDIVRGLMNVRFERQDLPPVPRALWRSFDSFLDSQLAAGKQERANVGSRYTSVDPPDDGANREAMEIMTHRPPRPKSKFEEAEKEKFMQEVADLWPVVTRMNAGELFQVIRRLRTGHDLEQDLRFIRRLGRA
jgi:hypothetical protein